MKAINMKIYKGIVACLLAGQVFILPLCAQTEKDKVIFKAMEDELLRNKNELSLANAGTPFFISYACGFYQRFEIAGSLGAVTDSYLTPCAGIGNVRLLLGNYHLTSDPNYAGQFIRIGMPAEESYDVIRRNFWLGSDIAYKKALQSFAWKKTTLKTNPLTPEEEGLDDLSKIEPVTKIVENTDLNFDRQLWEKNISELSAIFKDYKELFNSRVVLSGLEMEVYKKTTEGTTFKQPVNYVNLYAQAMVRTEDGVTFGDVYSVVVRTPQELPALEELKKQMRAFAENLSRLREAESITEYYSGPVLFEDAACLQIFSDNLLNSGGLLAYRKPVNGRPQKTLEARVGRKVVDSRITIKNYTTLKRYNNVPLVGSYEIDAEGVIPEKETVLVENGILKQFLNGRVPTLKSPASTGSSRFIPTTQDIVFGTAPGTIHIQVKDGVKSEKMKKALLKAAREEGLDYAYIVRKIAGMSSLIYKVNVKDGSETLVRFPDFRVDLTKIKRLPAISNKEKVSNYFWNQRALVSMIHPTAILVEDLEINKSEVKKEKAPALKFPLKK